MTEEINHNSDSNDQAIRDSDDGRRVTEEAGSFATEEKYQRLAADFANYKKRTEASWRKFEEQIEDRLLNDILTIYDDFQRLDPNAETQSQQAALIEGVNAVQQKWQHWLQKLDIQAIDPQGASFDHNLHEAISYVPVDSPELHNKVVQVIQKGYRRGERIIRHAQVILGKYADPEPYDGKE